MPHGDIGVLSHGEEGEVTCTCGDLPTCPSCSFEGDAWEAWSAILL